MRLAIRQGRRQPSAEHRSSWTQDKEGNSIGIDILAGRLMRLNFSGVWPLLLVLGHTRAADAQLVGRSPGRVCAAARFTDSAVLHASSWASWPD